MVADKDFHFITHFISVPAKHPFDMNPVALLRWFKSEVEARYIVLTTDTRIRDYPPVCHVTTPLE